MAFVLFFELQAQRTGSCELKQLELISYTFYTDNISLSLNCKAIGISQHQDLMSKYDLVNEIC